MSHFSSPRRSIRAGPRRSGPRLRANQINRGSVQSVDIVVLQDRYIWAVRALPDEAIEIPLTRRRRQIAVDRIGLCQLRDSRRYRECPNWDQGPLYVGWSRANHGVFAFDQGARAWRGKPPGRRAAADEVREMADTYILDGRNRSEER